MGGDVEEAWGGILMCCGDGSDEDGCVNAPLKSSSGSVSAMRDSKE